MRLSDTRSRRTVDVTFAQTVRLYVCGITPYAAAHLGHASTYVQFDVLVRYLEHLGHTVLHTRNITDVDDDILRRARELGVDYVDLGRREIAGFHDDLVALGCRPPTAVPYATQTIPAIRRAVRGLVELGSAYALPDGRVYFDTDHAGAAYGAFSGLPREEMARQFAAKGGDPEAPGKRSALDFLLWQPSAADEPAWPAPLEGLPPGRPGWHIECSAMAMETLGAVIDVHGGGDDLVFPHHEAEVLQSEALTGQAPFARAWLHTGMVRLDGVKMSKSLGNLVFARDLRERVHPLAVRRYLLEHRYAESWDHDEAALAAAAKAYGGWITAAAAGGPERSDLEAACWAALDDDLDTPRALAAVDAAAAAGAGGTVRRTAAVLGFDLLG